MVINAPATLIADHSARPPANVSVCGPMMGPTVGDYLSLLAAMSTGSPADKGFIAKRQKQNLVQHKGPDTRS